MKLFMIVLIIFPMTLFGQNNINEKALSDSNLIFENKILQQGEINRKSEYTIKNIVNGTGTILEFGSIIRGYMFNYFDTTRYGKITAIEEYKNNKKNGKRIQFFNYPSDTASVETYSEDTLDGVFYYNHVNGKKRQSGIYQKGKLKQSLFWNDKGDEINANGSISISNGLFYDNGKICNGHHPIYKCYNLQYLELKSDLYFTEGRIDSAILYKAYGYWGKQLFEIHLNYVDSTRKCINYYGPSGYIQSIRNCKILYINSSKKIDIDTDNMGFDNDSYIKSGKWTNYYDKTNIISDEVFYENDVVKGEWLYYDQTGTLLKR